MFAAGGTLLLRREHSVVAGAVPSAIDCGGMQTGPTGHSSPATLMAGSMVIAKTAFKPSRIFADPRRRVLGEDDPASLLQKEFGDARISLNPFDMKRVGVLADGHVKRAGDASQVHVNLHLRSVLWL